MVARSQNKVWEIGRKVLAWFIEVWVKGIINRIKIEAIRAITPPNFLGIDRRMA